MIIIKIKFEIECLYTQTKHSTDVIMPVRLIFKFDKLFN